jgi:hypothetical protein
MKTFLQCVALYVALAAGVVFASLAGCTDASRSQIAAYGSSFRVTLYSGGEAVRTWKSTGKVLTEEQSDGWYFTDAVTGKLVLVSGDVVVEQE